MLRKKQNIVKEIFFGKRKQQSHNLNEEDINRIVFSDDKEQSAVFKKVETYINEWVKENDVRLSCILFVPHSSHAGEVCFIYSTNDDISLYNGNGISEKLQVMFYETFKKNNDYGLNESFIYNFESDENINELYMGSYDRYLRS